MENVKYNSIGTTYNSTRKADERIASNIISALNLEKGSIIADIGAGTGNYSYKLAEYGFEVLAIEPSEIMRTQGKRHDRVNWIEGVAEDIPLYDKSVDGVHVYYQLIILKT